MNDTTAAPIVKAALLNSPDMPSRTMARMLHKSHPRIFKSVDCARQRVLYYRGRTGSRDRLSVLNTPAFQLPKSTKNNPLSLPATDLKDFPPYVIDPMFKRGALLFDIHVPYHDINALTLALKAAREFRVDFVALVGDFMDCYQLSRFEKDPECRDFNGELTQVRHLLMAINKHVDEPKLILVEGNHELRFKSTLMTSAPVLLGCEEFRLDNLLKLKELGADYVADKRWLHFGKLNILHGHELGRGNISPVNPARTLYSKTKATACMGHHHQHSQHQEKRLDGTFDTTWSVGCLCDLRPRYLPVNNHGHGFALVERDAAGWFRFHNRRILKGKIS